MRNSGFRYADIVLRILGMLFLSLYCFWTRSVYPDNRIWFFVALLLFAIGLFRKLNEMLVLTLVAELVYGGFEIYKLYFANAADTIGWNDLLWLAIFPFFSLLGTTRASAPPPAADLASNLYLIQQMQQEEHELELLFEPSDEFMNASAFLYKLEEEVLKGLRERRKFVLLVIEIEHFREYKRLFGADRAKNLLNLTVNLLKSVELKANLGPGLFAVILTEHDPTPDELRQAMDGKFYQMLLTRPRRENTLKLRLKYGQAECPTDGIEAKSLIDSAQQQLNWHGAV